MAYRRIRSEQSEGVAFRYILRQINPFFGAEVRSPQPRCLLLCFQRLPLWQLTAIFLRFLSHPPTPYSVWYTRFGFPSRLLVPRRSRLGPARVVFGVSHLVGSDSYPPTSSDNNPKTCGLSRPCLLTNHSNTCQYLSALIITLLSNV